MTALFFLAQGLPSVLTDSRVFTVIAEDDQLAAASISLIFQICNALPLQKEILLK